MGRAGVAEGSVGAEGRIEDVSEEPGEVAFRGEAGELVDAEVEVVVLGEVSFCGVEREGLGEEDALLLQRIGFQSR